MIVVTVRIPASGFDTSAVELIISTSNRPPRTGTQTSISAFLAPTERGRQGALDGWLCC